MAGIKGLLSICCTCYNHEKYIEDCIKSIWNNSYKNVEIIVIDDGSKDNSVEVLNRLKEISPCPFEVISQENTHNIGLNFNRALAKANGEFVTFMSCDDYYTEDAFLPKMDIANSNDDAAIIISRRAIVHKSDNTLENNLVWIENENITNEELSNLEYKQGTFAVQGNIFRRQLVDEVNGFDEDIKGDDIVIRTKVLKLMAENTFWKLYTVESPAFIYRKHSGSYSSDKLNVLSIFLDVYDRYWKDRAYPPFILNLLIKNMYQAGYLKCIKLWIEHLRAFELLTENEELLQAFNYELKKAKNKRDIFRYIFRKELSFKKVRYVIFNLFTFTFRAK